MKLHVRITRQVFWLRLLWSDKKKIEVVLCSLLSLSCIYHSQFKLKISIYCTSQAAQERDEAPTQINSDTMKINRILITTIFIITLFFVTSTLHIIWIHYITPLYCIHVLCFTRPCMCFIVINLKLLNRQQCSNAASEWACHSRRFVGRNCQHSLVISILVRLSLKDDARCSRLEEWHSIRAISDVSLTTTATVSFSAASDAGVGVSQNISRYRKDLETCLFAH